jgi:hypothetical protein
MLVPVDQHVHMELRLDERQHVAHAPSRRQPAARAAGGPGENDTSSHE